MVKVVHTESKTIFFKFNNFDLI